MNTFAVILIAPTVMFLVARLFSRRRIASPALALFEWCVNAVFLLALTLLLFSPTRFLSLGLWTPKPLSITYGKVTTAFNLLLAVILGALQGLLGLYWRVDTDVPPRRFTAGRLIVHLLVLFLLLSTFGYWWGMTKYPKTVFAEIVFYLHVPLEGTASAFILDVLTSVILPAVALFILFELLVFATPRMFGCDVYLTLEGANTLRIGLLPAHLSAPLALLVLGGWFSLMFCFLNNYLNFVTFAISQTQISTFIEEHYVDTAEVTLTFPQEKRNLINIYIESAETTFQDRANGGLSDVNYTPEMTRIAAQNLTFSQSDLIQGAAVAPGGGWTTAGLVTQTSGTPLQTFSNNNNDEIPTFLPGVTALGDILKAQGYRTMFMAGSDFTFGGRRVYFTQHGDYEVWDLFTAYDLGILPADYLKGWGFEDEKLYAYAKDELTKLAESDQPFHFSMLTVDMHAPGNVYDCCPTDIDDPYVRVVACASRLLGEFIDWCEQQPFFENTTIVITGDHASMADTDEITALQVGGLDKYGGTTTRLVYNAFINAVPTPVQANNRQFTTLDFFPTVLASIGVTIDGERLGLGTNLFSDRQTLAEEYGYETFFQELSKVSKFYNEQLLYP